jgi:trehalose/maltose hydrolase-like predicted phosphorylase
MEKWNVVYDRWIPKNQPLREALTALGNGYFVTRGAAEEMPAGGVHYPGTYLAGGYSRAKSEIAGKEIINEDLVNWPNWLLLRFRVKGGDWFACENVELLNYRHELDMYRGVLERHIRFKDEQERITTLSSRRVVSMHDAHLAAIQWKITAENWSGEIQIHSALDGRIRNEGVERYRKLTGEHLEFLGTDYFDHESMLLVVQTRQSRLRMAQACSTRIYIEGEKLPVLPVNEEDKGYIAQNLNVALEVGKPLEVEKVVSIYTSRDQAISEPVLDSKEKVNRAGRFQYILSCHKQAWKRLWHRCDMRLGERYESQLILRLHIFHLLQTASFNTIDLDVGIPSRGWHGEAYRGHIFWDELFIFPFLNYRIPELTRSLLLYRYRRLPEARYSARKAGYRGAMFPWQSGSDGREESQIIHLNPMSGEWDPDHTYLQRHVNAAIAYNVCKYFEITRDVEFLSFFGAEMVLCIALFWSSKAVFNEERGRYEIREVVGPDEYHTRYPGSDRPGLNNNAYTNIMAAWNLSCAIDILEKLDRDRCRELREQFHIDEKEIERWQDISTHMFIPFMEEGLIAQFEGYQELEEFDWEGYREKYKDIQRLDRILKSENDTPNSYKASKQADVLMLFYLFSTEELEKLFTGMGYDFKPEWIPRNIEYYQNRSSNGSSLSRLVSSWVLSRSDRERSWALFKEALMSDYRDIQGGTTPEGIHLGAMSGTVDMIQRCYTGLHTWEDVLYINPVFPRELKEIHLRIRYRGLWIRIHCSHEKLRINVEEGWTEQVKIGYKGKIYKLNPGDKRTFQLML